MHNSGRTCPVNLAIAFAAVLVLTTAVSRSQESNRRGMPTPPPPAEQGSVTTVSPGTDPAAAKRAHLAKNEKDFREGVQRLYQLVDELRTEVQQTPTPDVLSVRMYKKTEEIEKLARQLKSKAKGG
jgi:hypothetical protein